jgi:hypothetical protein
MNDNIKELVDSCLSFVNDVKEGKNTKAHRLRIALALIGAFPEDVERDAKTGNLALDT